MRSAPEETNGPINDHDGFRSAIAANYHRLTAGQRKAIDRMLADTRYAAVISAPELAQEVGVSESTITRAAQALGFSGYPDLQSRLREQFFGAVHDRMSGMATLGDTPHAAAIRVMLEDAETVRMTAEDLQPDALIAATQMLVNARRVYIFGARGSHGLAVILGMGLRLLLPDTLVLSQAAGDLEDQLLNMGPEDALVGISFRRIDSLVVKVVSHAASAGAKSIVITDHISCQPARLADVALIASGGPLRLQPSYAAAASLINAMLTSVSLTTLDDSAMRLDTAENLWKAFGTHIDS